MSAITFPPQDVRLPCAEQPELFTRDKWIGEVNRLEIREAKRICATCPHRVACLEWAMQTRDPYTLAGGLTPRQRDNLRYQTRPNQEKP